MDNEIMKAESNLEEIYTSIRAFVITALTDQCLDLERVLMKAVCGKCDSFT